MQQLLFLICQALKYGIVFSRAVTLLFPLSSRMRCYNTCFSGQMSCKLACKLDISYPIGTASQKIYCNLGLKLLREKLSHKGTRWRRKNIRPLLWSTWSKLGVVKDETSFRCFGTDQHNSILAVRSIIETVGAFRNDFVVTWSQPPMEEAVVFLVHFKLSQMNPLAQI